MKKATVLPKNPVTASPRKRGLTLGLLLRLQAVYFLAGIGYNVVSFVLARTGGGALSPTDPVTGLVVMAVYGGVLAVGALGYARIYRMLMGLCVLVLGYGGVVVHLLNYTTGRTFLYASMFAWALAVGINLFGLVLNFIGALGLFSDERN